MTMTQTQVLAELEPWEYGQAISDVLGERNEFEVFLSPDLIQRTCEYLISLRDNVDGQLADPERAENKAWLAGATRFRGMVNSRLGLTRRTMGTQERARKDAENAKVQMWKRMAHALCEALDESDQQHLLDTIPSPFSDMTAAQWYERRLEKRGLLDPDFHKDNVTPIKPQAGDLVVTSIIHSGAMAVAA